MRFERVLFYYVEWQEAYRQLQYDKRVKKFKEQRWGCSNTKTTKKNIIEFCEGLSCSEDSNDPLSLKLVIIDFMKSSLCDAIVDLFIQDSYHKNLSVILISQNLFHRGHGQRDISLNANYIIVIVVFKNPCDRAQIRHLVRQVYPDDEILRRDSYYDATSRFHRYLLLDLKQSTPDEYRFRTCIFFEDTIHYVYVPRRSFSNEFV